MSKKILEQILLVAGVIALIVVLVDLGISIVSAMPNSLPARIDHVTAGPYPLTVRLYKDPANAGYAVAFDVTSTQPGSGKWTYHVDSLPGKHVDANPVRATFATLSNGIQGAAEITVQGPWTLQIQVDGSAGHGVANVPINAVALPAMPTWLGWLIGFIPFYVLIVFFVMQWSGRSPTEMRTQEQAHLTNVRGDTLMV
jgi:hypothetical protein